MNRLAGLLIMVADQVHLAEAWLTHNNPEQARIALDGAYAQLVALAEEVDR